MRQKNAPVTTVAACRTGPLLMRVCVASEVWGADLALGADKFYTFDRDQAGLARATGMTVLGI